MRVNENLTKKREEKGLVTVIESINETDPNKTTLKEPLLHGPDSKSRMRPTKLGQGDTINEEEGDEGGTPALKRREVPKQHPPHFAHREPETRP